MYESSGLQFFRTTSGIKSGPDNFDELRFIMTFLNILGVTEILHCFRLVLEGKMGKEIPEPSRLEFLGRILANNFDCMLLSCHVCVSEWLHTTIVVDKLGVYFDSLTGNFWHIAKLIDMSKVPENICWTFWNFLQTCILQTRIITDQNFWKIHYTSLAS